MAAQPVLGRAADVWGYPASYVVSGGLTALALPFLYRSRRQNVRADTLDVVVLADATTTDTAVSDMAA